MKVKTYQTRSINEAVEHIKRDFGPDAMILGTRSVTTRIALGNPPAKMGSHCGS